MNIGRENETTEFKETLAEKEEAMKDISAILNHKGTGTLYFGVKNNGDVRGLPVGARTESEIAEKINGAISPAPMYSVKTLFAENGCAFIEVSFSGKNKPYFAKGVAYIRHAERSDPMPPDMLQQFFLQRMRDYSAWEESPTDCTLSEIDEALLKKVFETGNESNRLNHPYSGLEDGLRFLHLLTPDGRINKAGELLFAKNAPYAIRLATLADVGKTNYLDMSRAYGNVFSLIESAHAYIMQRLDFAPMKSDSGIIRSMEPEIPSLALRELIVNAFDHADYSLSMEQEFDVFPNRVSIYSPGVFPAFVTPEQFAAKEKDPINKNGRVARALFASGAIENFGTGFTTAFASFREKGISYSYAGRQAGFQFDVYRKGKEYIDPSLDPRAALLSLIRQNNYMGAENYAKTLGIPRSTAFRYLDELETKGKIEKTKAGKSSIYRIVNSTLL